MLRTPTEAARQHRHDRMPLELPTAEQDGGYFGGRCIGAISIYQMTESFDGESPPVAILDDKGARIKIGERRCKRPAITGGRVCMHHGGGLPTTRRKAAERVGYAAAKQAVVKLGMVVANKDPRQILLEQVYAAYGMVLAARTLLNDLDPIDLFAGSSDNNDSWVARGKVTLYAEWVDRAARTAKMALDSGIDERLVHLAEQQSNLVVNIIQVVINRPELAMPPEMQTVFKRLVAQEFRTLALGSGAQPIFDHGARAVKSSEGASDSTAKPDGNGAEPAGFDADLGAET